MRHLLLGACAIAASCAHAGQAPTSDASAETELLALTETYNDAWERLDVNAILRFHPDDVHYYWYGGEISSRAAFEAALRKQIFPDTKAFSIELVNPHVEMLGPDAGIVSFRSRASLTSKSGAVQDHSGAGTYVFEKRSGRWMIVHIHESGKSIRK